MKNINAQLKALSALKDLPEFGGRSVAFLYAEEARLMAAIGHEPSAVPTQYGVRDYVEYYRATIGPVMARSFVGAVAGVVLLLSGWLTTVSAASNSLPGDPLYGFKLITEQVQLRIASLEQRAVLHTEFAERRLNEAVALQQADNVDVAVVRAALDGFKREVSSANSDLQTLQQIGSADAVATAGKVEEKLASLDAVLDQSVGTDVTTVAQEAKDISREAQTTAVAVVVDTHEAGDTEESTIELKQMFTRKLGDLEARQSFALHRIEAIARAIDTGDPRLTTVTLPSSAELGGMKKTIKSEETRLDDALATYGLGGYRAAFDMLLSIDGELQQEEYRMAQIEITITQAFSQTATRTSDEDSRAQEDAQEVPADGAPTITPSTD